MTYSLIVGERAPFWLSALAALGLSFGCSAKTTSRTEDPGFPQEDGGGPKLDPDARPPWQPGEDGEVLPPGPAEPEEDGSEYLFDQEQLRTFELTLADQDLAFLDADPMKEQYVSGKLTFEGQSLDGVGIRYKGSIGSFTGCLTGNYFPPTGAKKCPKLGMKVKIDHVDPSAKFFGMKKLLFHAMNLDGSLLRERLGYALFSDMGVHASRAVHVRLMVNGKYAGLFLLVEEVDGRFARRRFTDGGTGNLYKEAWPSSLDPQVYLDALETNRNENPSPDKMVAFATALTGADDKTLPDVLADWVHEDYTARYVAVDRAIKNDDGSYHWYCGAIAATFATKRSFAGTTCGNHNYYWYEDTKAQRMWPVPWDLDNAMSGSDHYVAVATAWDDLNVSCTSVVNMGFSRPPQMPATCDPFARGVALSFPDKVRTAMAELLAGPFSESEVNARFNAWKAQIGPAVEEAYQANPAQLSRTSWELEVGLLQFTLANLRTQLQLQLQ